MRSVLFLAAIFCIVAIDACPLGTVGNRKCPNMKPGDKMDHDHDGNHTQLHECPHNNPCASGRAHPYKACRDDLSEAEMAEIEHHVGFCTKSNRFVCVRAFNFAGCCRNPCATLTSDPLYEGAPLTNEFGCQLHCRKDNDCNAKHQPGGFDDEDSAICVDGACCVKPLFDMTPEFKQQEDEEIRPHEEDEYSNDEN